MCAKWCQDTVLWYTGLRIKSNTACGQLCESFLGISSCCAERIFGAHNYNQHVELSYLSSLQQHQCDKQKKGPGGLQNSISTCVSVVLMLLFRLEQSMYTVCTQSGRHDACRMQGTRCRQVQCRSLDKKRRHISEWIFAQSQRLLCNLWGEQRCNAH